MLTPMEATHFEKVCGKQVRELLSSGAFPDVRAAANSGEVMAIAVNAGVCPEDIRAFVWKLIHEREAAQPVFD